jgi:transposase-like protein
MITWLIELAKDLNLWVRERIPFAIKAEAVLLTLAGLSLADVSNYLSWKNQPVARQNVGVWTRQFQEAKDWIDPVPKKKRKYVAVDETKIKINGEIAFIWGAIDVKTSEILALEVSWQRSGANALWFLKDVLDKCSSKKEVQILTDGAGWYPWACRILHITHKKVVGGKRNKIERWWRTFKEWAITFYKNFITRSKYPVKYVAARIKLWAGLWYNVITRPP